MSKITKYEVISAGDDQQLSAKVNEKIREGWQPFGCPFALNKQILQAVVLSRKAEKRIRKNSED